MPRLGARRIRDRRERQIVTMPSVDRLSESISVTIVLVQDDPVLRASHAQALREAGHEVREAEDGAQALALVRARAPDLLLIDAWLPILNGLEVLERLKSSPEAVGLSTVVLSNQNDADTRLEGSALGVVDCWTKDISAADLRSRVEQVARSIRRSSERGN